MAKRFATIFFITIGIVLGCVSLFAVVLFMAPGFSIFGIKYIAKGTHIVSETCIIAEKMDGGNFSGSIRVEVDDVPVHVVFSSRFGYRVEYYDNYNGLTNSNFDDPSIKYEKDADGTAVIKITSFKKFVFENPNSTRYIKLLIPSSVVGGTNAGNTNLKIVSKTSPVHFYDEVNDNYDPVFKNIEIETYGKITSSTKVTAETYKLKTINTINISDNQVETINANNYVLESTGGRICVNRDVAGDITATTKNSRIQILSCNNFIANSGYGDVYSASADKGIVINGSANIATTAGKVEIDSILGTLSKSIINTKTGNVNIKKAMDVEVTTTRGFVNIVSTRNSSVTTSSGSITIEEVTDRIIAKSRRGKVLLGGEENILYNPTVETTFGEVDIKSASGTVRVDTIDADVNFTNTDASDIAMNIGGNLTAINLVGLVDIEVSGTANLDFLQFTQRTSIVGTSSGSTIVVRMLNNEGSSFSYNLQGNDASLFEYNVEDTNNHFQIERAQSIISAPEMVGKPLLAVSSKGRVMVYYKRSV